MTNASTSPVIKTTKDGSTTLYSPKFRQHYHNPNGAVAESRHVFFEHTGLLQDLENKNSVHILEVGFGTGLNLLLLMDYHQKTGSDSMVHFYSIEAFPVNTKTVQKFEFGGSTGLMRFKPMLINIFDNLEPGLNSFTLSDRITLHLFVGFTDDFFQNNESVKTIGYVFHDPFSPEVNPGLWSPELFRNIASLCKNDAVLSTYCAASSARAAMAVAGWNIARAQGALGKREMTIASLSEGRLKAFKQINEERLKKRFEQGDFL